MTGHSADDPNAILQQSVIDPMAPLYATETLGYGGRLSGPNNAAVVQNVLANGKAAPRVAASSCMSCRGVAEWPIKSSMLPMASGDGTESPYFGRALPTSLLLRTGQGPCPERGRSARMRLSVTCPGRIVMDLTLSIPDELASWLRPVEDRLPEILELGLREWLAGPTGYAGLGDVVETLARLPSAEEVLALRPTSALRQRIE